MQSRLSFLLFAVLAHPVHAEDGHEAWLRYAPLSQNVASRYATVPTEVWTVHHTPIEENAAQELVKGLSSMLGKPAHEAVTKPSGTAIILSVAEKSSARAQKPGSFRIIRTPRGFMIEGADENGELYGAFHFLEMLAAEEQLPTAGFSSSPAAPIRWVNQWDNLDGSIERGYAGRSIFFDNGHVRQDLTRVSDYARLLASIGINGVTINNVNSDLTTLQPEMIREFARVADAMRPWGIRISLSVDLSSPQVISGMKTFDPLDPDVAAWWKAKVDEIYRAIPDFAGFVVKADSEGRAGPSQYHRTPAEAANVLARPLAKHGGLVLYRGFVYDHHLDYNNLKADRARAGYDNFRALDGKFEPNVVLQVKHGPIDFQVREPVSPLLAAMRKTPQVVEVETSQEYTGQQRQMVYLVPMWKGALDTDMRVDGKPSPVKEIVEGKTFHHDLGGFVSVVNVGLDTNWLHHPMALANLYGYGKLAWNPDASAESIVDSWTRLTFGNDPQVVKTIDTLQLNSWPIYEQYTGPLGLQTLTDITGWHYGPNPATADHNGWGQWIRAEHDGLGMDRTTATGTGYIGQYPPELAAQYESLKTCPDDLLLFMHHLPYTYKLHSGQTVIQYLYNAHYDGAAAAGEYAAQWKTLAGKVDNDRYDKTLRLFEYQAGAAIVWRDDITKYFANISGIADTQGRVGHYPNRIEAETMKSNGYKTVDVKQVEAASNGKAAVCEKTTCTLESQPHRDGTYRIAVQYFDLWSGASTYELLLNGKPFATWKADDRLPPAKIDPNLDANTSTRFVTAPVKLAINDKLTLRATSDGDEHAPVDYIEFEPVSE
ncbi:alpha-glucuronidase family glycosyl hydrolase [Granulicella cerasi]|uniref:alpha-glucuronidase family glycosyl hydrolase n=1 Tax=Granulicella cerasi TaxID=741063 RepID=UPI0021E083FA|nr:alpha-glucuronidase family glycosyl hydrolase [Granulicella cerasi]